MDVEKYASLLKESKYSETESDFLISGFKNGFSIGYSGPTNVKQTAPNLKIRGVGNDTVLWNKVMKEVGLGRYAGPFKKVPYENFIQSPIGLVPKDGGKDVRLIFHLSYPRGTGTSVNANTPPKLCSVQYPDFSKAILLCLKAGKSCKIARSDLTAAFRNLGILRDHWRYLVMKAKSPIDGQVYFFVDKCLPFGSSISCSHFQRFSNSLAHIVIYYTGEENVNYLDDYLFIALLECLCNKQVEKFIEICKWIRFPVSMEKTFWATCRLVFLGLLIDTIHQCVCIPTDKISRAVELIQTVLGNKKKKVTLNQLQKICGFLNFLCRCVVPGRAFTRRLYANTAGKLKPHHHIRVSAEMRKDLETWLVFLQHPSIYCRPFLDFTKSLTATEVNFFSDASGVVGLGAMCGSHFLLEKWDPNFLKYCKPSIAYQELFALVVAVLKWCHIFRNRRVVIFCDNQSVCAMVNTTSSSCKNCMVLIRRFVLACMTENVRIFCKYIRTTENIFADMLSRGKLQMFKNLAQKRGMKIDKDPTSLPEELWPVQKIWLFDN